MNNRFTFISIIASIFLIANTSMGQIVWDGGGDGTSWNDALNWDGDILPGAMDIAEFNKDAIITGNVAVAPGQLKIAGKSKIFINTNATFGNSGSSQHGINIGSKCSLAFGDGTNSFAISIAAPPDKNGINNLASGDSSMILVAANSTLTVLGASNGINLVASHTEFTNDGIIQMGAGVKTGIKSGCKFLNNGNILMSELSSDGIFVNGGLFTNVGDIMISKAGDDAIEILNEALLDNKGVISGIASDSASTSKNVIAVGTVDTFGYLINRGTINVDGGISSTARAISIYEKGVFHNIGTINGRGGNTGTTIYSRNELINDKNAIIKLQEGRISINKGSFVNDGLIEKSGSGTGVFSGDSLNMIVNNAFFKYDSSSVFAGGNGSIIDNGAKLNNFFRAKLDANKDCFVDIAEKSYDWFIDGVLYASSSDEGKLDFAAMSILADSVILTTTIPEVNVKVVNICNAAVETSGIGESLIQNVSIYPTVVSNDLIYVDNQNDTFQPHVAHFYDQVGHHIRSIAIGSGNLSMIDLGGMVHGVYMIKISDGKQYVNAKFIKM